MCGSASMVGWVDGLCVGGGGWVSGWMGEWIGGCVSSEHAPSTVALAARAAHSVVQLLPLGGEGAHLLMRRVVWRGYRAAGWVIERHAHKHAHAQMRVQPTLPRASLHPHTPHSHSPNIPSISRPSHPAPNPHSFPGLLQWACRLPYHTFRALTLPGPKAQPPLALWRHRHLSAPRKAAQPQPGTDRSRD